MAKTPKQVADEVFSELQKYSRTKGYEFANDSCGKKLIELIVQKVIENIKERTVIGTDSRGGPIRGKLN